MSTLLDTVLKYNVNGCWKLTNTLNRLDYLANYSFNQTRLSLVEKVNRVIEICFLSIQALFYRTFEQALSDFFFNRRKSGILRQIKSDIVPLRSDDKRYRKISTLVDAIIKEEKLFDALSTRDKALAKDIALATYATSYCQYAPVVLKWAKSLLVRAKATNTHLVFLARDGIAPFEAAKTVQEHHPELKSVPISCLYLSRRVVKGPQEVLCKYLSQELNLQDDTAPKKKFLFVDIGFIGSTIPAIRKALEQAGVSSDPHQSSNKVDFEFLVSTADKAHGYVGNLTSVLPAVRSAGQNRAVYWMEDTHQGILESPRKIEKDDNGVFVPDSVRENKTCKKRNELDFLCKKIAAGAVQDLVRERASTFVLDSKSACSVVNKEAKEKFDAFLQSVNNHRYLYVDHN